MSESLTFLELVNLAIGTPELGSVNFNALHFFLYSMLEHLHLSHVKREISEDEKDFLKPPPGTPPGPRSDCRGHAGGGPGGGAGRGPGGGPGGDQEVQLQLHLPPDAGPDHPHRAAAELPGRHPQHRRAAPPQPAGEGARPGHVAADAAEEEDGGERRGHEQAGSPLAVPAQAMNTLQDLLSNVSALKKASETFQADLGNLKESFSHFNLADMKDQLQQLDEHAKAMEELRQQIVSVSLRSGRGARGHRGPEGPSALPLERGSSLQAGACERSQPSGLRIPLPPPWSSSGPAEGCWALVGLLECRLSLPQGQVKARTGSIPDFSDLVQWGPLYEMLAGKTLPEKDMESREKTSRELLSTLGQMPEKHDSLVAQVSRMEAQLGQTKGLPPELGSEVKSLLARMEHLQYQTEQGQESLQSVSEQVQSFKRQCEKLQKAMDRLTKSTADIQLMRDMLEQLDVTKADKAQILEEIQEKADKSALEAKVNHGELRVATSQLSEMMHDLLQKMSLQDKDWQKALEKLFVDMDCKLDRMALDPLSRQLEAVWKVVKKYLSEGPRFDADSAAGFKKCLFERVKCISCDRPVTMMTGPHMVTVRKATLRPRPASANGYEYLARPHRRDSEGNEVTGGQPQQTCWQCQAHHQSCTIKQLSRSQDLTTIYPYGDPTAINYDNVRGLPSGPGGGPGRSPPPAVSSPQPGPGAGRGGGGGGASLHVQAVPWVCVRMQSSYPKAAQGCDRQLSVAPVKARRPPSALRMERARSATTTEASPYVSPYAISSVRRIGLAPTGSFRPQEAPPQGVVESLDPTLAPSQAPGQPQEDGGVAGL
ncbi:hypothetical protein lerEdw1_004506 [Lerista edwardsae]|nr:hypothetical protein lerEdw1_004506 [Lerista edwardsae]